MNKSDIIKDLCKNFSELTKEEITRVCDIVFKEISDALIAKDRVEVRGFGSFSIRERLVNAEINESEQTQPRAKVNQNVVYYRAGKELTDKVN